MFGKNVSLALLLGLATAGQALAQDAWKPAKSVEVVVNGGAGGGVDNIARLVQSMLTKNELVDVPVTVVNKGGAGGALGLEAVAKAPPDGTTIGFTSPTIITTPLSKPNVVNYRGLTPLAVLSQNYVGFAVKADSPIKSAQDIVDRLKADPGSISFANGGGVGNQNHIAVVKVADAIGVDPTKLKMAILQSGGETTTSVLGGHVDVGLTSVENFLPYVRSGDLRIVAVSAPERLEGIADVPTWKEQGVNSVAGNWYAIYGPPGMDAAQVEFWSDAMKKLSQTEAWTTYLRDNLISNAYQDAAGTKAFFENEDAEHARILKALGLIR